MPTIRATSQFPDMLLYSLGQMHILDPDYPKRLKRFLSGDQHIYLCNASGTGKTRLLFESLAQEWGIYLTCFHDRTSDPYGSPDLQKALSELAWDDDNNRILSDIALSSPDSEQALILNRQRVATLLRRVILARLLVLDCFIDVVNEMHIPDAVARRKWLILQLLPTETVGEDVFVRLIGYIDDLSDPEVFARISTLRVTSRAKAAFVAIDEAQVALKMHRYSFVLKIQERDRYARRRVVKEG
ncbi:hypothetical protein EXIGLDRAFT_762038 [Exidia glandulosa HHB12029]|uniref:Uncharacterized protein n=1 Tax=Exidia glandulosa HHB12029 TaxID=1314781 RepID=A0A165N430_EXIGL|nr:hypothetical protein EXIGLDRAFT_762038 [Exidia glandulosa HHB12029]